MPYQALVACFNVMDQTTKRLEITAVLRNFFRSVMVLTPEDLVKCVYLCTDRLAPAYEGVELGWTRFVSSLCRPCPPTLPVPQTGIGDMILYKATCEATGLTLSRLREKVSKEGDLGTVAANSRGGQGTLSFIKLPPRLTITRVFETFTKIAKMSGDKVGVRVAWKVEATFCSDVL